ncbi:hypothetical protein [Runella sp. SP2]|uniref:hypothetical protein n=1 Tax=Runella sp. SP2 TaxID=2268026 RepID=UPI000F0927EA|nr:hypothetical protein [Runella sp. SP2]AYQ31240.1 hypothetical protein DTQ70_03180 [Runella sp. SP2]
MALKDFNALLVRLFLGYLFTSSGLCKLTEGHFGQLIGPPLLIQQLTPHGLRTFGFFIATSQVIVGALVMSQRYSLLGLIMLVPMNLGILMVTISQNWQGTPYVDAVFTLLNLTALLYEWQSLKFLLLPEQTSLSFPPKTNVFFPEWKIPTLGILFFVVACISSRFNVVMTSIVATVAYGLMYVNMLGNKGNTMLQRWTLGMSFVAIMTFTWVGLFHKSLPFNPMIAIGFAVLGTMVSYLILIIGTMVGNYKMSQK